MKKNGPYPRKIVPKGFLTNFVSISFTKSHTEMLQKSEPAKCINFAVKFWPWKRIFLCFDVLGYLFD